MSGGECGNPTGDMERVKKRIDEIQKKKQETRRGLTGWVCPVCGAGLSPYTARCPCKGWNYNPGYPNWDWWAL